MSGLQKKVIAKYIDQRVNWWAFSLKNVEALREIAKLDTPKEKFEADGLSDEDKLKVSNFQQRVIDATLVSGGAIASMLLGEDVNDLDIYFTDREVARDVAKYYLNVMLDNGKLSEDWRVREIKVVDNDTSGVAIFIKSQGVAGEDIGTDTPYEYFEQGDQNDIEKFFGDYVKTGATKKEDKPKHTVSFMSSNGISLANGIQLIFRFCGNAGEIHKNFDFAHCTNYWTKQTGLVYKIDALQALLEKRLQYQGSLFPVAALFRLRKFITRGYRISAGEMTKIAFDISKLDLEDPFTLREQLMGCDIAYFGEVINLLREGEKGGKTIDRTYLFTIIDKVFQEEEIGADVKDNG